ncbi:MAG: M42 family metallopeptidase [Bacilli bacterium]|nr:M42 family metallopeptidase [Bacilli bacterium]
MPKNLDLLKELSEVNGIAAHEKYVKNIMEREFLTVVPKERIMYDGLGSIAAEKIGKKNGPKILIVGHMDEIGMIVTKITDEGFIKFQTIGGWWSQVMLAQQMNITTSSGKTYLGVVGSKPPHILSPEELKNPANIDDMYIDLGVENKEEVEKLGIKIGDMITPAISFRKLANENYLLGKAWDDRIGCAIAIDVLKSLKDIEHPNIVYAAGSTQEEVGLRGAKTLAGLIKPDLAIALDTSIARDLPGTDNSIKLGKGPGIMLYDSSAVGHVALREKVLEVADELNIPYQFDYLKRGGTDSGAIHTANSGCPCLSICVETRYLHSHTSIIHVDDYLNAVKLIVEVIKRLDEEVVNKIIYE